MRLKILCAATVIWTAGSFAAAQTTAADGVAAYDRGDYERAVQILKPLAERWPRAGDPTAQYYMALMYESGRGVPSDVIRACALYGLAVLGDAVRQQSQAAFERVNRSLDGDQFGDCMFLQHAGFDHRFQPIAFSLDSDGSIAFDRNATTITYQGKAHRRDTIVTSPAGPFVAIQHTRLLTGSARSLPRHFIEVARWLPGLEQEWILGWSLSEVVRDDLVAVSYAELTSVRGEPPPADSYPDIRAFVQLGVNDAGAVEFAILGGRDAHREAVPSEAEREETAARTRARGAADERVDWARIFDESRRPAFVYEDADGCGAMRVFGWSADRAEALVVTVDHELVPIEPGRTLTVSLAEPGVDVSVHVYNRPQRSWPFCSDVIVHSDDEREETWRATGGTMAIELSSRGVLDAHPEMYRATVRITGAEFIGASGPRIAQLQAMTLAAIVGFIY